jgi:CubicO group peptidase (beta-lactamase class C family)
MLAGLGAMALPTSGLAAPRDWPATQAFLADYVDGKRLACCVVSIQRQGRRPEYLSRGTIALDSATPAGPDSIFRIYSMTKPVTGVAFMTLVEKGVLSPDQPVADVLPEFRDVKVMVGDSLTNTRAPAKPMLMRHLVTHTAGLSYHINGQAALAKAYEAAGLTAGSREVAAILMRPTDRYPPVRDLETFGRRLATLPLDFDPGARWQYSVGLDLMGLVIQRAAGMPFEDYLRQTLFDPLKMHDTDFVVPRSKQHRLTSVYNGRDNRLTVSDDRARSPYSRDRDLPSGGGGAVSTASDYLRFQAMLLNEGQLDGVRVMKPETVRMARSSLMDPGVFTSGFGGEGNAFGAGVQVLSRASALGEGQGTYGWDGAAGTTMWIDPVNRIAVNGMVQIMGGANIHNALREAVYKDLRAKR